MKGGVGGPSTYLAKKSFHVPINLSHASNESLVYAADHKEQQHRNRNCSLI